MDRAIREIITPVVERSVTIACMTTRELVLKVCGLFFCATYNLSFERNLKTLRALLFSLDLE